MRFEKQRKAKSWQKVATKVATKSNLQKISRKFCVYNFLQIRDLRMVGASGFEPETFCTPSKRATSLRYAPMGEKCPQNVATFL